MRTTDRKKNQTWRRSTALATLLLVGFAIPVQASDLSYTIPGMDAGLFAEPTSEETVYVSAKEEAVNIDRSKNAACIPPVFGSPTSYVLGSGEYLTPNLVRERQANVSGNVSAGVTVMPPAVSTSGSFSSINMDDTLSYGGGYTEVNDAFYDAGGSLGTISIPAINLKVKVYQGTDSTALKKGAGHFTETSIWDGNAVFAGHNRGVANHFGKIHTLSEGDEIIYTTKLGTRHYRVYSVTKIRRSDVSVLQGSSTENILTLITCVMNQPDYRWCVQAVEQ